MLCKYRKKREPLLRMTLGEIRRRPTLPGRFQPSTISVLRLNFCVRYGNRWIPQAIVTGNMGLSRSPFRTLKTAQVRFRFPSPDHGSASLLASTFSAPPSVPFRLRFLLKSSFLDQALDRLVSPSSIHYCTSTDDLSTLSSSRGLTCLKQWQFSSLGGLHA